MKASVINMPRVARKYLDTSFFHVMVQGINKEFIFKNEKYCNQYIKLMKKNFNQENIEIIAYCIMNNHAHIVVQVDDINELSKQMQKTNTVYAKYYNENEERVGYVFRDRYKSQPIMSKRQLIQCVKYIHRNPIKAKMVKNAIDYPYSSYSCYKNGQVSLFSTKEMEYICNMGIEDEEDFIDIEPKDIEKNVNMAISEFVKKERIKVFEIFEKSDILKKLIKYLKMDKKIKYVDIMKQLDITEGIMRRLKK